MASRSNLGGAGGVEIKVSGDTTPLEADIAAAKAKVEAASVGGNSGKAAEQVAAVGVAANASAVSLDKMAAAGAKAVGPDSTTKSGVQELNKALGDTVGQVQGLIGKFTIVAGVATGMFALGRAIREHVIEALKDGTTKAKEFAETLTSFKPSDRLADYEKQIDALTVKMVEAMERARKYEGSLHADFALDDVAKFQKEINVLKASADEERDAVEAKRRVDEAIEEEKANSDRMAAWEEANIQRLAAAQIAEHKRLEDEGKANLKALQDRQKAFVEDAEKRLKLAEDFKDKLKKITEDMADDQAAAARKTQEAWSNAFTSIRSQSNEVFGSNRAMGNVGVASALTSLNTRAGASNRILYDGGN